MTDPDDEPIDTPLKKRIKIASERVRHRQKNIFNIGAALAANPNTKKNIKLPTFSWDKSEDKSTE